MKELISNGNFERGRLGIAVSNLDEEKLKLKLSVEHGVVVESLEENSSAKFAGIQPMMSLQESMEKINNYDELLKVVSLTKVGETLNISIIRDGETKTIPVRIRKEYNKPL